MNQEHLSIIRKVANNIAPGYIFGYFSKEDIIHEAIIIGMDGYNKWDGIRPLENFISVHISNRLKNLRRDNYYRAEKNISEESQRNNEAKRNIMSPLSLTPNMFQKFTYEDFSVDNRDEVEFILDNLNPLLKNDFLRLANGVQITRARKEAVYQKVRELIEDR